MRHRPGYWCEPGWQSHIPGLVSRLICRYAHTSWDPGGIVPVIRATSCARCPSVTEDVAVVVMFTWFTFVVSPGAPHTPSPATKPLPSPATIHKVCTQKYFPGDGNTTSSEVTSPVPVTGFTPEVNARLAASHTGFPSRLPLVSVACLYALNPICQLYPAVVAIGPVMWAVSRALNPSGISVCAVVDTPGAVTVVVSPGAPQVPVWTCCVRPSSST